MHLNRSCAQFGPNVLNFRICSESAERERCRCKRAPEFSARSHWSLAKRLALAPPLHRPGPTWAGRSNLSSIRGRCRDRSCATVFSTFPLKCSAPAPLRHRSRPNVGNKVSRYVWTKKDMFTQRWPTRLHSHSHPTPVRCEWVCECKKGHPI